MLPGQRQGEGTSRVIRRAGKSEGRGSALGIDIGQYAVKAILLERMNEGIALRHAARDRMPPDAVQKGVVVARREVATLLRQIVQQSGASVRAASLAVPTEQMLVRWIDLPVMDGEALRAATRFEARKYLPYPVDQAEVAIVPMEQGRGDGERMRALLAAAPRDVVRSRAETLEMAGLEVASVELEPIALVRALSAPDGRQGMLWRGQPLAYVHLGGESSGMCVVQDTSLRFVHAISWGCNRLTQTLAAALDRTPEAARAITEQDDAQIDLNGVFSWDEEGERRESDALVPEFDRLYREIQRLLNYYRSLFPERSYEGILDRLVLCGGSADLSGLDRYFSAMFQVEVAVRNPFQSFASRLLTDSFTMVERHSASFAVAVGLALGDLQTDTLPERGAQTSRAREFVWRRKAA